MPAHAAPYGSSEALATRRFSVTWFDGPAVATATHSNADAGRGPLILCPVSTMRAPSAGAWYCQRGVRMARV